MAEQGHKNNELNTLGWSMAVLCVTLIGIYSIFFGVQGSSMTETIATLEAENDRVEAESFGSAEVIDEQPIQEEDDEGNRVLIQQVNFAEPDTEFPDEDVLPEDDSMAVNQPPQDASWRNFYSFNELFGSGGDYAASMVPLSGTYQREGVVKSADILGLTPDIQYILKDIQNTHYVYLGAYTKRLESTVLWLGGNIVEINDKNDIKHNLLFGERVWFINLPEYEGIKVLFIVFFGSPEDAWFIQVDADQRYTYKQSLAASFDTRYDR